MRSLRQRICSHGLPAVLVVLLACGGDTSGPPAPATLTLVSNASVSGVAGQPIGAPLTVKVTSSSGATVPGIVVSFEVANNGGTLSQSTVTTSADGTASTTWTLGTVAGEDRDTVRASISQLPDAPVLVTANVAAAPPAKLAVLSGDKQPASPGTPLPQPLVILASDQFGNPTSGVKITWTVEGGGTLSATSTTTNAEGKASVTWTAGSGTNRVHASATGLTGSPATFEATFTSTGAVVLTSVSPATLVEGQGATLTGTGFGATPANDIVIVDGVPATVVSATATTLAITVPSFDCRPTRDVDIRVAVSGDNSNVVSQPLNPAAAPLSLAVGQELVVQDPATFCLQFAQSSASEAYLIGVQSTSEVVSSLTPVHFTATAASNVLAIPPAAPVADLFPAPMRGTGLRLFESERARRWARHRAAEGRLRAWERQNLRALPRASRPTSSSTVNALAVSADVATGDSVTIRVPDAAGNACAGFNQIQTVVRAVGTHGVWLEDVANPANGFSAADFQSLSDEFDSKIYDTDASYFGAPDDIDANGRVIVVITKEVNKFGGLLGFVAAADLVDATTCPSSNHGEIFYGVTPDPIGTLKFGPYDRAAALQDAPFIIAHEFSHIIQFEHRLDRGAQTPFMATWTAEGQATLAEEVVGHAFEGRSPGQNYGLDVAFALDDPTSIDWYADAFGDLEHYYGFRDDTSRVAAAPEQCSWLAPHPANSGPCLGGRDVYGVPWSFLRWLSDQYGPTFPGGEQGLQQALIDNDAVGYANITAVVGVPINTLLAQWAAMLYVDDRVPGVDPKLTMPSWNLFNIFEGSFNGTALSPSARLMPRTRSFSSFSDAFSVRAASTAYYLVDGATGRPATAIRVRGGLDGPLPTTMQLFVVRTR